MLTPIRIHAWFTSLFCLLAMPLLILNPPLQMDAAEPPSGFLGIGVEDTERGPLIYLVVPSFPGHVGGLLRNDVIVSVGDHPVKTRDALTEAVSAYKVGDTVSLAVRRGDATLTKKLTVAAAPSAGFNELYFQFGQAIKERDATELAKCFGPQASVVDQSGHYFQGMEQIRNFLAAEFARDSLHIDEPPDHIRFLSPSTLISTGIQTSPTTHHRYTMVWSKSDDRWNIESFLVVPVVGAAQ